MQRKGPDLQSIQYCSGQTFDLTLIALGPALDLLIVDIFEQVVQVLTWSDRSAFELFAHHASLTLHPLCSPNEGGRW